jgi:putative ABC transport system ATP-binding protein
MITLQGVTKTYKNNRHGDIVAVRNLTLAIKKGETIILSGPSGSGKSTVLNMIAGLIKPTSGSVEVAGQVVSKLPEHFASLYRREKIGMIFQQFNLINNISAADNIALPLTPSGMSAKDIKKRVTEMITKLDILDRAHLNSEKLSGGEMQRVAIARALINNPAVILADEPTANLDSKLTADLIDIFSIIKTEGRTIVIATHDSALTNSALADRVIKMSKEF